MRIERIDHDRELALCSTPDGARSTVEVALVLPVSEGETLLVHAGTAIAHAPTEPWRGESPASSRDHTAVQVCP
jgi:hydrogenase maturation factor